MSVFANSLSENGHTAPLVLNVGDEMQKPRDSQSRPAAQRTRSAPATMQRSRRRYKRQRRSLLRRYPWLLPAAVGLIVAIAAVMIIIVSSGGDDSGETLPIATPEATAVQAIIQTPEPTATAVPKPLPTLIPEYELKLDVLNTDIAIGLPESAIAPDSYFDDTVFVGDSVSEKLKYYVTKQRKEGNPTMLGNAKFLTAPSFSARNALKEVTETSLHPTYQGQKMKLEDVIEKMGVKKVYIMLGLNDVGIHGVEKSAQNMMRLLKAIRDKCPDVQIFVQSATPRVKGNKPTTKQLLGYNLQVYDYILKAQDPLIYYVDVAHVMRDEAGKLREEYCSDLDSMALHFNNTACQKWVDYLYTHALI